MAAIEVLEVKIGTLVIIDFPAEVEKWDRPSILRNLEAYFHENADKRLEVFLAEIKDKNSKRRTV